MLKKDYMKEVQSSLKLVRIEIDKNIINGEIDQAFKIINKEIRSLVGLDMVTIDTMAFSDVINIIGRENQYNAERYIALSELLYLQGSVFDKINVEENKISYYKKAIESFYEAYIEEEYLEEEYLNDAIEVIDKMGKYELSLEKNMKIFKLYEAANKFDKAEDVLFTMIKQSSKGIDIIKDGINFYLRLKKKSYDELTKGNLPINEIEESLEELIVMREN
ncbi:DUF6483 family protein [Clostridium vincentii]|uniref:Tetratricopeptide repeat protein n=1 Tax=Clostridium vincentii TaxID=52704 RepID=A0A2T0BE27_9CLOT|nr:DUF6483 family protein [Clostridium vincentii]PRR82138.1 hypothetical protein CLVI_19380 [Clostridium vincentii]